MSDTPNFRRSGRHRIRKEIKPVQTIDRALSVLETVSRFRQMYLSEISRRTGLHPSTVFRILETLKQRGYVEYDENTGLYLMGVKAFELGNSYLVERPLSEFASQAMRHLAGALNETVNLAVQDGSEIVYIKQEESSHTFRMFTKVGARAPLYCTAIGKVLLAWQDADLVKSLLGDEPYPAFTSKTLTSFYSFMEEVRRVPVSHYAWDNEEREEGVRCMAAPIHSAEGMAVAAISVSGPTNRFTLSVARQAIPPLIEAAKEVSRKLGYQE